MILKEGDKVVCISTISRYRNYTELEIGYTYEITKKFILGDQIMYFVKGSKNGVFSEKIIGFQCSYPYDLFMTREEIRNIKIGRILNGV